MMADNQQLHLFENWKLVPGFEGRYSVSDCGRVRNNETGRFLSIWNRLSRDGKPYQSVCLYFSGEKKLPTGKMRPRRHFQLHRLIVAVFRHDSCDLPDGWEVHHDNRNRLDNRLSNLIDETQEDHWARHRSEARLQESF